MYQKYIYVVLIFTYCFNVFVNCHKVGQVCTFHGHGGNNQGIKCQIYIHKYLSFILTLYKGFPDQKTPWSPASTASLHFFPQSQEIYASWIGKPTSLNHWLKNDKLFLWVYLFSMSMIWYSFCWGNAHSFAGQSRSKSAVYIAEIWVHT